MPVAVPTVTLLELLVASPPSDEVAARVHADLWAAAAVDNPALAAQFRRLLDAAEGVATEDGGEG